MRIALLALCIVATVVPAAYARPVSYPGGWTLMLRNDAQRHWAHLHYSPTVTTSIGYKFEDWRDREFDLHALQINNLLKRWNQPDSQANVYWKSGFGLADQDAGNGSDLAGFSGFAADWENRRYFIGYENRYTGGRSVGGFFTQSARLGWAPYAGDYGDLHTWLMLDTRHTPDADDKVIVTPLVRLFKDIHLVEMGVSHRGDVLFNYVFRY